ncbi:MAG: alpha-2-macroglobulin family protein [Crocinitomicaceae bacterium]
MKWLHGAVAKNLKAKVDVTVSSSYTSFEGYKGFIFDDPIKRFSTDQQTIFNDRLDQYGVAQFDPKIYVTDAAPGMLKANFVTKVFEEGGAFSIDRSSIKYSPYEEYAGVKIPQGKMYGGTLETDQDHIVEIATVDEDGKPTSTDCEVKVFKLQWRWWWDSYDRDIKSYISRSSTTPIFNDRVRTSNGKGKFNLRVNRPEYGRYLVYVKNLESGHTTGRIIYIDWPYWARANRKNTENSTMLAFSTDKEAYMTNEQVKLSIPSSSNGRALITVENGTKVLQKFWVDTKKGETKVEFQTTEAMSPNAYVHVSLIQPHAETENDLPIRMYGVVPIMVENPKSHLSPVIKMADELKPETTAKVRIAEKSGRPMTYTLAIVDEGLLDLTSFKTPDPWNHFYAKEALGVKTWDLYDEVLGAFGSKINKMLAIGGDGAGAGKNKQAKVNRFKPMVRFVGPFYYNGNGENTHDIDIPNYVGSVRVMVIAGQDQAYGNAEKTVPVKAPLMVLGTLPRVLGPGEEVDLPVNVFATEDYIKDVQITISANDLLIPKDGTQKSMSFSKKGDKVANFRLKVAEKLGVAKVRINVKSGGEHAHYDVELAVRPSNPETVNVQEIVIQPGESWKGSPEYFGIEGTNSAKLELSTFPPLNLEKRLKYLIRYPHGCIEQTTSGAFPQLYLARLMELNNDYKITIQQNVDAAIARISLFQTSAGGFSYWPGGSSESEWGTNYAGHFLLEAEKLGYKVPSSLISRWERYQKKKAKSWYAVSSYEGRYNDITQAYRLYTLALADKADLASMNRLREKRDLSITARWRLAAAYKLAGQYEIAEQLVKGYGTAVPEYTELSYTFGNSIRDEAMILETLTLMDEKTKGFSVARRIAEKLSSQNWMSTQTTAYCLLSLGKYMGKHLPTKTMYFEYKIGNGDKILKKTLKPLLTYDVEYKDKNIEVTNKSESPLFVRVMTTGIPMQGREQRKAENVSISIDYKDMDGNRIDPKRIEQGTDFIAEVTVRNSGLRGYLKEMALNQIFPSGWEIHNTRMDGFRSAHTSSSFVYQDFRDDRVYTYYNLAVNQTRTYRIN